MKDDDKYFVIPVKYMKNIGVEKRIQLREIMVSVQNIRKNFGKDIDPSYIVCKESEPYSEDVWKLILDYESKCGDIDDQMLAAHDIDINDIDAQMLAAHFWY